MLKIFNKINWLQYQEMLLVLLLIIATVLLNKPVGDSFWRFDDPMILKCAIEYRWWEHFIIPESYQCLSAAHLTPWVTFSYALDYNLFGLEPKFFYYHQIFSLSLVSIFTFVLLRLYVNPLIAFFGILLFLIGSPVWVSSQQLMVRHYVEGLLFSIISIHFFILSLRFQKYRYALLGCLFYILATSAKEIYVPLLGILLFIPEGRLKDRFYAAIPYLIWGAIYIIWRKYMLGIFIGGYHPTSNVLEYFNESIALSLFKFPHFILAGEHAHIFLGLLIFIALINFKKYFLLNVISMIALIFPLLPLFSKYQIDFRFIFFLWWGICMLLTFSLNHLYSNKQLFILLCFVMLLFSSSAVEKRNQVKKDFKNTIFEFEKSGSFFWKEDKQKLLFLTHLLSERTWYFYYLEQLKYKLFRMDSPYLASSFNLAWLSDDILSKETWTHDFVCKCVKHVNDNSIKNLAIDLRNKTSLEKPLNVFVQNNSNLLTWKLGIYQGNYFFVTNLGTLTIPQEHTALYADLKLIFRIRYDSPEGWITYSPEFTLEKDQIIDWKRS